MTPNSDNPAEQNPASLRLAIAADHAAWEMKNQLVAYLTESNFSVTDLGTHSGDSVDYPDYAKKVSEQVASGEADRGILVCGTGIGMSMAANKIPGIRAVCCSDPFSARMSREHNDANVLCFGARVVGYGTAVDLLDAFLSARFLAGRHSPRVAKIGD